MHLPQGRRDLHGWRSTAQPTAAPYKMPIFSVRLCDVHHPNALMQLLVNLRASRQCKSVSCEDQSFEIDTIHKLRELRQPGAKNSSS